MNKILSVAIIMSVILVYLAPARAADELSPYGEGWPTMNEIIQFGAMFCAQAPKEKQDECQSGYAQAVVDYFKSDSMNRMVRSFNNHETACCFVHRMTKANKNTVLGDPNLSEGYRVGYLGCMKFMNCCDENQAVPSANPPRQGCFIDTAEDR